ncbi:AAA family ATPase [Archangium sp.]|jgi:type I restriction enzyme M protein|uniref:AAA family ATPase n=1 Tax=Archangium sp. TaxID=1872627 RepID=UPI002EDA8D30
MWRRVSLKNYRSIEKAEVELAPLTVLVGPNGSGKSNFADALVLASEISFDAASAIKRRGGLGSLRRWGIPETEETGISIRVADEKAELDLRYAQQSFSLLPKPETDWRFGMEHAARVVDGESVFQFERRADGAYLLDSEGETSTAFESLPPTTSIMLYGRQLFGTGEPGLFRTRRLQFELARMRFPQQVSNDAELEVDGGNLAGVLRRLKTEKGHDFSSVLLAMKRLIPDLEDLSVTETGKYLFVEFEQRQPGGVARFGISEMSEGALRALGLIVAAKTMPANRFLIIEEPEVSIHPGAAAVLYEVLEEASHRGSILVTTHSPEFLDAAREEEILVCQYRGGATRVGPLARAQRELVNEGILALSELMRSEPLRIEGEPPDVIDPADISP